MTSRVDVAEVLSQCQWAEEGSYLSEVIRGWKFPILVKVLRGQYLNLGVPSFTHPSLVSHLLLVSVGRRLSISAQCVKFKNQRQRVVPFGPTLAIPRDFIGHFEILSEDGRSIPPLSSVEALLLKFPDSCLVREPIKVFKGQLTTQLVGSELEGNYIPRITDKTRILPIGEVLVLVGELSVPSGRNKTSRYLRCFDSSGQTVYLSLSQKGKFSPLARLESISGVHTTKNILNKRMPMMVRLVDGKIPSIPSPFSKSSGSFKFVPELRLFNKSQEELIFAMPLTQNQKEPSIIPLPSSVPLKFQVCQNMNEVEGTKEFCRLHERLKTLMEQSKNLIQVFDVNLKREVRFDGRQWKAYTPPIYVSSSRPLLTSSTSVDSVIVPPPPPSDPMTHAYEVPDVQDYEDIDQIYDYVRGVKPQPQQQQSAIHLQPQGVVTGNTTLITVSLTTSPEVTAIESIKGTQLHHRNSSASLRVDEPPEPPPIETIPGHKPKPSESKRHVTMVVTSGSGGTHYQTAGLGSVGSSPNNTSSTSAGSGEEGRRVKRKNLYLKKQSSSSQSQSNLLDRGVLSGSPSNRILFRRSPIFDFRYQSMNDLNRSSLESRTSSGGISNQGVRFFPASPTSPTGGFNPLQSRLNSSNLLSKNGTTGGGIMVGPRLGKGIFRPKSLTNILSFQDAHGPAQPIDFVQRLCERNGQASSSDFPNHQRRQRRKSQSKLYL